LDLSLQNFIIITRLEVIENLCHWDFLPILNFYLKTEFYKEEFYIALWLQCKQCKQAALPTNSEGDFIENKNKNIL